MPNFHWYQWSPERLVQEYRRVQTRYPQFQIYDQNGEISWLGQFRLDFLGENHVVDVAIKYPEAFPAIPPSVTILSPALDPNEVGHSWHRWNSGEVCIVQPAKWQIETTADEVIAKTEDWYFNYLAKKAGLIVRMPDRGRVTVRPEDTQA